MIQNPSYRISSRTSNDSYANGEININSFKSYGFLGQHNSVVINNKLSGSFGMSLDLTPNAYQADRISVYTEIPKVTFESYTKYW